jgi:hypothetical protein|tara:strand:- start:319 stop:588 length:270 start_codon:yes stop_codon:yes gene_type:complete
MATNIKTFNKRGGDGVIISSTAKNRIIGIHSYSTVAGVIAIGDQTGTLVTYEVPASAESDMYFGEMGIACSATVTISTPDAGSVTLIVG